LAELRPQRNTRMSYVSHTLSGLSRTLAEITHIIFFIPERTSLSMSAVAPLLTKTSTRTLTLYLVTDTDPISATLSVIDLEQTFHGYEAIPYTWGSTTAENTILVDGREVNVTANLHRCLWRLRSNTPRRLWCDYLCITQSDLREKAHQVQIIGSIFARSITVLIWLGEHATGSEHLFHDWNEPRKPLRCWPLRSVKYRS
jgi:hypothetical protein